MRLVYKPLSGEFVLEQLPTGGVGGGTVTMGVVQITDGTSFQVTEGMGAIGDGEFVVEGGSEILIGE